MQIIMGKGANFDALETQARMQQRMNVRASVPKICTATRTLVGW